MDGWLTKGNDVDSFVVADREAAEARCDSLPQCVGFTIDQRNPTTAYFKTKEHFQPGTGWTSCIKPTPTQAQMESQTNAVIEKRQEGEARSKQVPTLQLNNGVRIPQIGFGLAGLGDASYHAVWNALESGYRHFDSAQAREWYREDLVGKALADYGAVREDLFLTSKLHPRDHGFQRTIQKVEESLQDLGTTYLDLFLLHYPRCWGDLCGDATVEGSWKDSWRALERMHREGKIRAIGVSNFHLPDMKELLQIAKVTPSVLQSYSDPLRPDVNIQHFCKSHNIVFQAFSSLGTQWRTDTAHNPVLTNPAISAIAKSTNMSPAQVVLRWALDKGQVVLPRSSQRHHMEQNLETATKALLPEEHLRTIDGLAK
jgi:diketogulonate reductase-like aldo/keto reductase